MKSGCLRHFLLRLLCLLLCCSIGFSFALLVSEPQTVRADGYAEYISYNSYDDWHDGVNFEIRFRGCDEGAKISVVVSFPQKIDYFDIFSPGDCSVSKLNNKERKLTITYYSGTTIQGQAKGSNISESDASVYISSYEAPFVPTDTPAPTPTNTPTPKPTNTPTPTPTPKPTNTPTPKPTTPPTQGRTTEETTAPTTASTTQPKETEANEEAEAETTETTLETSSVSLESSQIAPLAETAVVEKVVATEEAKASVVGDALVFDDEEINSHNEVTSPANAELASNGGKKKMSSGWIYVIVLILLAGACFARIKYLKSSKDLDGKDLAIAFIPGVPRLAERFGYLGPVKSVNTIEVHESNKSFNAATAMKELKAMENASQQVMNSAQNSVAKTQSGSTGKVIPKKPEGVSNSRLVTTPSSAVAAMAVASSKKDTNTNTVVKANASVSSRMQEEARIEAEAKRAEAVAKAAEKARIEEANKAAEAARAAEAAIAEAEAKAAEARKMQEAVQAAEMARIAKEEEERIKAEEAEQRARAAKFASSSKEEQEAEVRRLQEEARAAEQIRVEEARRAQEEAEAAERARLEAAEAEKAAMAAKAAADAKLLEAQKAIAAAEAAREAKAEENKQQSKTSEVFKAVMMSSDTSAAPAISAMASVEGYDKAMKDRAEDKSAEAVPQNQPVVHASGASSGVGVTAAADLGNGPAISAERAKASSNSNQLGSLLSGKNRNKSGRVPVWSAPGRNVSAFKETEEAREVRRLEERKLIEEEEAKKAAEENAKSSYTSIVDSSRSHKSAFLKRNLNNRDQTVSDRDESTSAYGGIVRPSAVVDEERDIKKTMTAPAMGAALEGQRPAIMDPNTKAAPTASQPIAGFKPADEN